MNTTDYTPVDCGLHSEYELAIMHRKRLQITWRDSLGKVHIEIATPTDLRTRDGAEFLIVAQHNGESTEIRLDRIVQCNAG